MNKYLKKAISMFDHFFEILEYPVAIIDENGKYVYYNSFDAEIDNSKISNCLGKYILDCYENLDEETSTMLRALKYGEEFIDKHQIYITKTGNTVDYIHTTIPIKDENNKIIGAIEIGRDLSEIKKLKHNVVDLTSKLYTRIERNHDEVSFGKTIITRNKNMLQLLDELDIYAETNFPVLLIGETGTGKELFAKRIHSKSSRSKKSFITLNCAGIPDTLLESTLFGTEKGAFTGAENKKGLCELADDGTLFLDELNSMPIHIQPKLLRVLQDGTYMKLGGHKEMHTNARIVAAMNETPDKAIENGLLRRDLYYRISTCLTCIPPLRKRKDDISLLAFYFLKKYSKELNRNLETINPEVINKLEQNNWPGNVRMLENVIKRSIMLEDKNHIALNSLNFGFQNDITTTDNHYDLNKDSLKTMIEKFEYSIIYKTFEDTHSNINKTAEALKIPRSTLQYKLEKYNIK